MIAVLRFHLRAWRAKREGNKVRRGKVTLVDLSRRKHRTVSLAPTSANRALLKQYADLQEMLAAIQQRMAGLAVNHKRDMLLTRREELEEKQTEVLAQMREHEVMMGMG